MFTEGELRGNLDDTERVRDLQDKITELKAEVMLIFLIDFNFKHLDRTNAIIVTSERNRLFYLNCSSLSNLYTITFVH